MDGCRDEIVQANKKSSGCTQTKLLMKSKAKIATFAIGNLLLTVGVLWCVAGAGIYGSPLAAFGSESWWIVAYIGAVAVLPGIASWLVFHATVTARLLLLVGAVFGCIVGGRYLFTSYTAVDPLGIGLAFILPGILILLVVSLPGRQRSGDHATDLNTSEMSCAPGNARYSIRSLLVVTAVLALSVTHGRLAKPPSNHPTDFYIDYEQLIPQPDVEAYDAKVRAGRDLRSVLKDDYQLAFGYADSSGARVHRPNRGSRPPGYSEMTEEDRPHALLTDLRAGLRDLLSREALEVVAVKDTPGGKFAGRGYIGFSMVYRTRGRKGLVQAYGNPKANVVNCLIREQPDPGWLTAFAESHRSRRNIDWSEFESSGRSVPLADALRVGKESHSEV